MAKLLVLATAAGALQLPKIMRGKGAAPDLREDAIPNERRNETVAQDFGTPTYVYDAATLKARAEEALAFPNAYGLTVRYAMKACPNGAVLKLFESMGLNLTRLSPMR